MALLFPNSVKVVISLNCGITWSNSSVCFLRGRKSCPLAGLWGGHELEKSPQYASLEQLVSVMGMDVKCMGMSTLGSCCGPGEAWLETVSGFPLMRMEMGTLGVI